MKITLTAGQHQQLQQAIRDYARRIDLGHSKDEFGRWIAQQEAAIGVRLSRPFVSSYVVGLVNRTPDTLWTYVTSRKIGRAHV